MLTSRAAIGLVLASLAFTACGGATSEPTTTSGPGDSTAADAPIPHPTGAGELVLRVESCCGFVPVEISLRTLPSFSLYGDGTVIVPGPVTEIYPGPLIAPLTRFQLDEAQVQRLLAKARDTGLLAAPRDYGDQGSIGVTDAPTTRLTIHADGGEFTHSAYALGIDAGTSGLAPEVAKARQALADFIAALPQEPTAAAYAPERVMLWIGPYAGEPTVKSSPVVWPLDEDLATAGLATTGGLELRCLVVDGAAATKLVEAGGNEATQWVVREDASATYRVLARPMLPDEPLCPIVN